MYAGYGWTGYTVSGSKITKIASAVIFVAIAIGLWGSFAAPRASHLLAQPWLFIFQTVLLVGSSIIALRSYNYRILEVAFIVLVLQNQISNLLLNA